MTDGEDATILTEKDFDAYKKALERPGKPVPGLVDSVKKSRDLFEAEPKDAQGT